jgi:hypothetical protein
MPTISGYPSCCGASIITGFGGTPDSEVGGMTQYNPTTGRYEVTKAGGLTAGEKLLIDLSGGYANRLYTCILTVQQFKHWGKWLKANGFEFTTKFVNSVHNSILYHFVYVKRSKTCKVKNTTEPPKGWEKYPGPTPDAESSKDEAVVQPSGVAVAA